MKYIIILISKIVLHIYCSNLLKLLHPTMISVFLSLEQKSPYCRESPIMGFLFLYFTMISFFCMENLYLIKNTDLYQTI